MLVKEYLKNCGKNYTSGATSLKAVSSSTETNEQENLKIGFAVRQFRQTETDYVEQVEERRFSEQKSFLAQSESVMK